jgi:hypothetical protein
MEESMSEENKEKNLEVFGALIQGFAQACVNLNIVAGSKAGGLTTGIEFTGWYPLERWRDIMKTVLEAYKKADIIMERVGVEMMRGWYYFGPGKEIVKRGIDFLHYQSGSQGYESVVKGPQELVGSFKLVEVNEQKGTALVHSTTPFDRDMERGVLIGGMSVVGDLDYVDVDNSENKDYFKIEFH